MDVQKVRRFIKESKIDAEIIDHMHQDGTRSEDAAEALGVDKKQVLKVLLFINSKGEKVVVIIQGSKRVDLKKVEGFERARIATEEQLKEILDAIPGGIPPIALPDDVKKIVDEGVLDQSFVIGSAGSPHFGVRLDPKIIASQSNTIVKGIAE